MNKVSTIMRQNRLMKAISEAEDKPLLLAKLEGYMQGYTAGLEDGMKYADDPYWKDKTNKN